MTKQPCVHVGGIYIYIYLLLYAFTFVVRLKLVCWACALSRRITCIWNFWGIDNDIGSVFIFRHIRTSTYVMIWMESMLYVHVSIHIPNHSKQLRSPSLSATWQYVNYNRWTTSMCEHETSTQTTLTDWCTTMLHYTFVYTFRTQRVYSFILIECKWRLNWIYSKWFLLIGSSDKIYNYILVPVVC